MYIFLRQGHHVRPQILKQHVAGIEVILFDLILYVHSTIFQLCGTVFLGWTSTKLG